MKNVFLEVINSVNLVNKKMNDNMKSLFSKYIKLLAVLLLSVAGVGQVWGGTLFSQDFTALSSGSVSTNNSGVQVGDLYFYRKNSSKTVSWGGGTGVNFNGQNMSSGISQHSVGFPVTGINENTITITITCPYSGSASSFKYQIYSADKSTAIVSATNTGFTDSDKDGTLSITITNASLSSGSCWVQLGESSSSYTIINSVVVTTPEPSCTSINPSLSYTSPLTAGGSTASPTLDKDGSDGAVTYSITATPAGCATINASTGFVTPVNVGTATVTASIAAAGDYCAGEATADITINCATPATLAISGASEVEVGSTATLTVNNTGAGYGAVTWSSGATGKATVVSSTGVVTGVSTGAVTITANQAEGTKYCASSATHDMTVVPSSCTAISPSLSYASTSLTVGGGNSAAPTLSGNTGSGAVTYSSSNTSVATVDASGVVTPVAAGSATITASIAANGGYCAGSATANFTVAAATYSITYDCDGAESGCPSNVASATTLPNPLPSAPTKSGYTFDGWFTNAGKTDAAVAGATLTANATLYAKWTAAGGGGGSCEELAHASVTSSTTMSASVGSVSVSNPSSQAITTVIKLNSSGYVELTPKAGYSFAAGDKITVNIYNQASSAKTTGFQLSSGSTNTTSIASKATEAIEATLVAGDIVGGKVKVLRNSSDGWIGGDIIIERCASCTKITPTFSTDYASTTLTAGGETSSTPEINKDGSSGDITWTSSNDAIATVNSSGVVTPVAAGSVTITATVAANGDYCSGTATANFTINAAPCTPPAAPTGLAASSITTSGAALTITDGANTNNYDIYYSTSSTAPTEGTAATVTSTSKTKNLTGLTASTEYYVWVRSVCDESNKSAWVALTGSSFTTNASVPVISVKHSGNAVASGSTLDLGSVAVAPASVTNKAIDVLNTGTETLNILSIVISNTSGSAFGGSCAGTCPSVSASSTEQFNVSIAADLDPGTYTGTVTINSNDPSTPAYSFNITYTVRDASGEIPILSVNECTSQMTWTNVAGAASYDVDICTGTTVVKEYEITGSSAASSMVADGDFFVEGKNYGYYGSSPYYFVLATTVDNNSTSKKEPKETTAVPGYMIIKMVNPETLYMTVNEGNIRKFFFEISTDGMSTWSTPVKHSEAADVAIDINKMGTVYARITCAEDTKWTRIHKIWYTGYTGCTVTNNVSKPYTPNSLTAGTTYYASVRGNNSDWSDVVEFTAPASAVSSVTATPAATSVTLTWPASAGATGYVVTINGDDTEVSGTTAIINGLTSSTNYTATVKAKTGSCLSAGTNVSFTTLATYTVTVNYKDKTGASISGPKFRVGSTTSAGTATSENMIVSGGAQTISAIGTSGYGFDHWELSNGTRVAANEIDSVIASNVTLTAVFAVKVCTDYPITTSGERDEFNKLESNGGLWESVSRNISISSSKGNIEYNQNYLFTSKAFDNEVSSVSLKLSLRKKKSNVDHPIQVLMYNGDGDLLGSETITLNSATDADCYDQTPSGRVVDVNMPAGTHSFAIKHDATKLGSTDYNIYFWHFSYCLKESVQKVGANITPRGTSEAIDVPVVVKMAPTIYYTDDDCLTKTTITAATASDPANSEALLSAIKLYALDANDVYQDVTSTYLTNPVYSAGTGDSIVVTFNHSSDDFDYLTQYKVVVDDTKIVNAECMGILNNVQVFKTMAEPKAQITIAESCGGTIFENGITRQSLGSRKTEGTLDKTFYIKNTGTKTLNINSITLDNAQFTITAQSGSTVAPGECETFTVRYTTTPQVAFETLISTVTVASNDDFGNETFKFTVTGATAGFVLPYTYESGCTNPSASPAGIVEDYDTSGDRRPEVSGGTFIESLNIYSAIGGCAPNGNSAIEITDSNPLVINTTKAIGTITIGWASTGIRKLRIVNGTDIAYAESAGWENANECHELTATINDCTVKGGAGTGTATVKIVGLEAGASAYIHYIHITPCDPEKQSADCNLINVESANMVDGTFEVEGTDAFITVNNCSAGVPPTTFTPTTLTVSPGATITPKVGVPQTLNAQGFVTYVVTAADGITKKTYHLYPECPIEFTQGVCYADSVKVDYLMYAEDKTIFVNGIVSADEYGKTGCSMEVDPYSKGANYTIHYLSKEDKPLEGYKIEGPSQVCVGSVSTYRLSNAPESNAPVYKWSIEHNSASGFAMVGNFAIETKGGKEYEVFTGPELKLKAPNVLGGSGSVDVTITIDLDFTDAKCEQLKGEASTTIKATDKAPNPVAWIENGCATQNGRLELVAHQIPASGDIPADFVDATKFEWSFETTPSGQKVTPVLSHDSTYVLSMGTNAPGIRATVIASNGCGAADPYVADLTYSAANTTWTGAESSDWNDARNWTKQVPSECTDVTIPMVKTTVDLPAGGTQTVNYYPVISTEGICDEITFLTGAGVKGLEHLSYRRAYVKATYQRDKWYTLTNPLKEMVSGDYYYSGVPLTYMRKFDVLHSENGHRYTQEWTKEYTGLNVPLAAGEGFAYQVSNKSRTMSVSENPAPAGDQVVTFPRMTSDSSLVTELHKFNPLNGKLLTKATMLTKTENSYRFAYDGASVTDGVKTPTHASYGSTISVPITAGEGKLSLIGNPMMCHLNLGTFLESNSSVIEGQVTFWNGGANTNTNVIINEGKVSVANPSLGIKLPPMQGFFVKNRGNETSVTFNVADHFVTDNGDNQLRSADASSDGTLYVTGNDGKTTSYLSVRKMEGASNGYAEGEDAEKIFNAYAESEIYTLAGGVSTDINHFSALPYETPLAVNTTADKDTVDLTFKGAESFENVNVTLVNKKTGEEINLKDENKYKFIFTKDEAETMLVLRFTSDEEITTDAEQAEADASGCDVQIFTKGNNTVRVMSSSSNQIREVSIFDASGKLIAKEVATGNGVTVMDKVLNAGARNVVVTAVTDNCVKTEILQLK